MQARTIGTVYVTTLLAFISALPFMTSSARAQELPELPQTDKLTALVRKTMTSFGDAIIAKRFDKFRDANACNEFFTKTSAKQMGDEFKPFIDNHIDLSALRSADIILDGEPTMIEAVLRVAGHFDTQPMRVYFDLAYQYENHGAGFEWRLYGMTVSLKKAPASAGLAVLPSSKRPGADDDAANGIKTGAGVPAARPVKGSKQPTVAGPAVQLLSIDNKMRSLITATLLDFNTAVQRKDFTQFLAKSSPAMQKQTTPAKLADSYALFMQDAIDISDIAKTEPHFREPPSVKNGSILTLKGFFQISPTPVLFDADYFKVGGEWKLLGLNVQTVSPAELKQAVSGDPGTASTSDDPQPAPKSKKLANTEAAPASSDDADAKSDADMKKDPDMKKDADMKDGGADMKKEEK